jgi:hypothetical protein
MTAAAEQTSCNLPVEKGHRPFFIMDLDNLFEE